MSKNVVIMLDSDSDDELPLRERLKRNYSQGENNTFRSSSVPSPAKRTTSVHMVSSSDDSEASSSEIFLETHRNSTMRDACLPPTIVLDESDQDDFGQVPEPTNRCMTTAAYKSSTDEEEDDLASALKKKTLAMKKTTRKRAAPKSANSEERQIEKERKQQAKVLEKALKNAEREMKKSAKPEECLKSMQICLDSGLTDISGFESVYDVLQNSELPYTNKENPVPLSIQWVRRVAEVEVVDNQVFKKERDQMEEMLLVFVPSPMFVDLVYGYTQKCKGKQCLDQTLLEYVTNIQDSQPHMKLTCVSVGLDQHLGRKKDDGTSSSSQVKAKCVFKKDVDEAVVALNLEAHVTYYSLKDMQEFGQLLARLTKAIAEAPFKKDKNQQRHQAFSWYADADSSRPVKIEKDCKGFISLWQQQLTQFNLVGRETAQAIAAQYPSPLLLVQAYKQCSSQKEAENLLQDIVIRRGYGPLSSTRRVGPELSYKIYRFFTSTDGNELLQR